MAIYRDIAWKLADMVKMKKRICRLGKHQQHCTQDPKETMRSLLLKKWTEEYYSNEKYIVKNNYVFFEMGNEFVWKFKDCGWENTFFPLDRLSEKLENFLREKMKEFND